MKRHMDSTEILPQYVRIALTVVSTELIVNSAE
jgi:hypothetical protein